MQLVILFHFKAPITLFEIVIELMRDADSVFQNTYIYYMYNVCILEQGITHKLDYDFEKHYYKHTSEPF